MDIVIESNVPFPTKVGKALKWPFDRLHVGQSFLMPGVTRRSAVSTCGKMAHRIGGKFVAELVDAKNVRVWRIA